MAKRRHRQLTVKDFLRPNSSTDDHDESEGNQGTKRSCLDSQSDSQSQITDASAGEDTTDSSSSTGTDSATATIHPEVAVNIPNDIAQYPGDKPKQPYLRSYKKSKFGTSNRLFLIIDTRLTPS